MKIPDNIDEMFGDVSDAVRESWPERDVARGDWTECVHISATYVNPMTGRIEDDDALNTAFRVWIEAGGWSDISTENSVPVPTVGWNQYNKWMGCHDYLLDCGAPDLESALLELAVRVKLFYGDGRGRLPGITEKCDYCRPTNDDGFCGECGFDVVE
jgi:hypothetical protein